MKRRGGDRSLSGEEISVKRIVRHKEHSSPSPDLIERESHKRSEREVHNYSTASYEKYGGDKYGGEKYGGDKYGSDKYGSSKYHSGSSLSGRDSPSARRHSSHHFMDDGPVAGGVHHHQQQPYFPRKYHGVNLDQIDFSLHISNLDMKPSDEEMRRGLFREFKRFGYISVKVLGYGKERRAFINYSHYEEARRAKRECQNAMLYTRPLRVEWSRSTLLKYPEIACGKKPTNSSSGSESYFGNYHPVGTGSSREHLQSSSSHSSTEHKRDVAYKSSGSHSYHSRHHSGQSVVESKPVVPVLDPNATRTLFVGNLELDITERELRDLFSQFGRIESVDIKIAKSAGTSYAFVKFTTITDAINAKNDMHSRQYGQYRLKIGFGKGAPSGKVWVGNLASARDLAEVRHEMDRFGLIRRCDYKDGDNHAYVHFESLEAAQAAVHSLQGYRMRNNRVIKVDLHKPLYLREMDDSSPSSNAHGSGGEYYTSRRERKDSDNFSSSVPHHHRSSKEQDYSSQEEDVYYHHKSGSSGEHLISDSPLRSHDRNSRKRSRASQDQYDEFPSYRRVSGEGGYNGDTVSGHTKRRALEFDHRTGSKDRANWEGSRRKRDSRESSLSSAKLGSERDHDAGENGKANGDTKLTVSAPVDTLATSSMMEGDSALKLIDSMEPVTPDSDSKGTKADSAHLESLADMAKFYPTAWRGSLVLKNTGFPTRMHLVGGDPSVAEHLLRGKEGRDENSALRITQRLRLEQPRLEEVNKRISMAGPSGHCTLLALPGPSVNQNSPDNSNASMQLRPLRSLVSYLKQKEAAGIVALSASDIGDLTDKDPKEVVGVLHAFPPCEFSQAQLVKIAPNLGEQPAKEDHIVVLLVKGNV